LEGVFGIDLENKLMTTSEIKKILEYHKWSTWDKFLIVMETAQF
jgi:hypothetical protein